MEKKRCGNIATEPQQFLRIVRKAKKGDKNSMEEILNIFNDDIEYLSRYLMLPREEAVQILKTELISIVYEKL